MQTYTSDSPSSRRGVVSLLGGIITDVKDLLVQELTLAKIEMQDEVRQTKSAAVKFAAGFGIFTIGMVLLLIMLVHVLNQYTDLPLWSCYGILGGVCVIIGGIVLSFGAQTAEEIDLVPEQSIETFHETIEWIKETPKNRKVAS